MSAQVATEVASQAIVLTDLSTALVFGLGVLGPALAIGLIGFSALSAIGRNPSALNDIRSTMILAIAFAEALGIFAFVIAMMIKFV
ncbi:MAG: ATP synthase F0 subunit C [Candidatus Gracilibacteria bacterium]|nr:ATP synthase F0 subunit C [Candidatus Gracilibacteria bacterium]MDD4530689.1 ATP synthase F0 subunit C [Candidatus Gracilibacteria bacterium]